MEDGDGIMKRLAVCLASVFILATCSSNSDRAAEVRNLPFLQLGSSRFDAN
jgi:hypothetical protein